MGRVNSELRLRHATAVGCDTADGTYLTFGPHKNLGRLLGWFERLPNRQPPHVQFPLPICPLLPTPTTPAHSPDSASQETP